MEIFAYGFGIRTEVPVAEAEARLRAELTAEGCGVLTEIDVAATLKAKLGVGHAPDRILGACNPPLAHRGLAADARLGLLLPCNLVVCEEGNPRWWPPWTRPCRRNSPSLAVAGLAAEAGERLQRIMARLEQGSR